MKLFISALILLLAIEGSLFAAFPEFMRQCLLEAGGSQAGTLRKLGIGCLAVAIILGTLLQAAG